MRRAAVISAALVALAASGLAASSALSGDAGSPALAASCGYTICAAGATGSSFANASAAASAGSVVTVEPGLYPAQTILDGSTKAGAQVVFKAQGVTVQGDLTLGVLSSCTGAKNLEFDDLTLTGAMGTRCGSQNLTFRNMTASGVNIDGEYWLDSNQNTIPNNIQILGGSFGPNVDDNSEIKNGANGVLIDGAVFHDSLISDPANHDECIQIWGNVVSNVTIRNSIFRNCTDFDLLFKGQNFSNIQIHDSFFDEPEPGNEATTACNPNCPRGGNAVRFSTYPYPNSDVSNNVMNGGISIAVQGQPTASNNTTGPIPPVPPGGTTTSTPTSTSTSTSTSTTTSTTGSTTTTAPPPFSLCAEFHASLELSSSWKTYAKANPKESASVASYLCGGPKPSPATKFGTYLVNTAAQILA